LEDVFEYLHLENHTPQVSNQSNSDWMCGGRFPQQFQAQYGRNSKIAKSSQARPIINLNP